MALSLILGHMESYNKMTSLAVCQSDSLFISGYIAEEHQRFTIEQPEYFEKKTFKIKKTILLIRVVAIKCQHIF